MSSTASTPRARAHFTKEFTPGRVAGVDYMFGDIQKRIRKSVSVVPVSSEEPVTPRRMRAPVDERPPEKNEQQWPTRGLKKVENAPKDDRVEYLFGRRTLAPVAKVPADKKEQVVRSGKAMVSGRSHGTSGNFLAWDMPVLPKHRV